MFHDSNFLKEHNAKHLWHPMAHPADSQANPPKIIMGARDVRITDVDVSRTDRNVCPGRGLETGG